MRFYTNDPRRDPAAHRYRTITYDTVLSAKLRVLDQTAVLLARDNDLPIHVFDFDPPGAMLQICRGEPIGTALGGRMFWNSRSYLSEKTKG
jgi:uridylate kinase